MTADEVYAVSAYLYHLNGLIDEDFVMNAETMPTIEMPDRDAFFVDDRLDTEAERCMEDCAPIGTVEDGDYRSAEAEDTPDPEDAKVQGDGTGGQVIMGDEDEAGTERRRLIALDRAFPALRPFSAQSKGRIESVRAAIRPTEGVAMRDGKESIAGRC